MIFDPLGVNREVFISKNLKSLLFRRFLNWNCVKNSIESTWPLKPIYPHYLGCLNNMARLSGPECLSALGHLSSPVLFQKSILNHFKFKTKLNLLIPQQSLICHKLNLFRHPYNFPVGQTTTFDLQWRASHYLKRLLWPNIKKNKISNIKIRLNVLTPTIIIF